MSNKVEVQAEVHSCACKSQNSESMYKKISKNKSIAANEDERSSSGNWSAASSTCATTTSSKSPTQNEKDENNKDIKCTSCSAYSLSNQFDKCKTNLCKKDGSETDVINSDRCLNKDGLVQFRSNQQKQQKIRDSESWLKFFESNESTDTITNEIMNGNDNKIIAQQQQQNRLQQPNDVQIPQRKYRMRTKHRNEALDELLSIHSNDTGKLTKKKRR
jgi:hypothetical protein